MPLGRRRYSDDPYLITGGQGRDTAPMDHQRATVPPQGGLAQGAPPPQQSQGGRGYQDNGGGFLSTAQGIIGGLTGTGPNATTGQKILGGASNLADALGVAVEAGYGRGPAARAALEQSRARRFAQQRAQGQDRREEMLRANQQKFLQGMSSLDVTTTEGVREAIRLAHESGDPELVKGVYGLIGKGGKTGAPQKAIGPDGNPIFVSNEEALGMQPAPGTPLVNLPADDLRNFEAEQKRASYDAAFNETGDADLSGAYIRGDAFRDPGTGLLLYGSAKEKEQAAGNVGFFRSLAQVKKAAQDVTREYNDTGRGTEFGAWFETALTGKTAPSVRAFEGAKDRLAVEWLRATQGGRLSDFDIEFAREQFFPLAAVAEGGKLSDVAERNFDDWADKMTQTYVDRAPRSQKKAAREAIEKLAAPSRSGGTSAPSGVGALGIPDDLPVGGTFVTPGGIRITREPDE